MKNNIENYDKIYLDDFYWVVHFTESYEKFLPSIIESVKKYSNRKCILYSINYTPKIKDEITKKTNQFIFREIEIPKGNLSFWGRDFNVLTSKPKILIDVLDNFENTKFVHIDIDIYLTNNSDSISKYFGELENYPLANSHIHDVILMSNLIQGEEWTSTLHILLREEGIYGDPIFPRRKCNIILFDKRSRWFFLDQMKMYEKYYDSKVPGILGLHDEDTFNAVLTKNKLTKSLPLLDIEENYNLSIEKIYNYSYSIITQSISPNVLLPKTLNDFLFFHGFKNIQDYNRIKNEYGNDVLDFDEISITYRDNTLLLSKTKKFDIKKNIDLVDFTVKTLNDDEIIVLRDQKIKEYSLFYISDFGLEKGTYCLEVYNKSNGLKIYHNYFEVLNTDFE